ncbi:MAG: PcfJ domain-containing protein, partial [Bacteroides sp.]
MADEYKIWGEVYPQLSVTAQLRKYGLTSFFCCNPYHLVKELLQGDCKAETLIKTCQYDLLVAYTSTSRSRDVHWHWNQVKIATRHKYIVNDPIMWLDYLNLLNEFGKDLNNPHFICPVNLKEAHDVYMKKKQKKIAKLERMRKEKEAEEAARKQKLFEEQIKRFLDLKIKDEDIEIIPLRSIEDFKE